MTTIAAPIPIAVKAKTEKLYTLEEYLRKEETAVHKSEYHQGQIIRMPGGKVKHNLIAGNIFASLKFAIKKVIPTLLALNSDQKIYIPTEDIVVYPDALVISEKPQYWNNRQDLITNPLLIVEVLSKSTKAYDRGDKFTNYRSLESFREYVLVEQDKKQVEVWFKAKPNTWEIATYKTDDDIIFLQSIGISISMSDIYENIDLV